MWSAYSLVSLANQFVGVAPFLAGVVIALVARKVNPRVRWLVLAACLTPLVSVIGHRVFLATGFLGGLSDDARTLGYGFLNLGGQLLHLASGVLFLLAMAIVFRSRGPRRPGRRHRRALPAITGKWQPWDR